MSNQIVLSRFNMGPDGTFGRLILPNGYEFFTCERPWLGNQQNKSCIPMGNYILEKRYSPVVQSASGGRFEDGWEVTDVPGRSYIMIHPGNWPMDVEGCITVGHEYAITQDRRGKWSNSVLDSRDAFAKLMNYLDQYNDWELSIIPYIPEYP